MKKFLNCPLRFNIINSINSSTSAHPCCIPNALCWRVSQRNGCRASCKRAFPHQPPSRIFQHKTGLKESSGRPAACTEIFQVRQNVENEIPSYSHV